MYPDVDIYPCADTLLYFPVYLAVELLQDVITDATRCETQTEEGCTTFDVIGTRDDHEERFIRVRIHPPSGGDQLALRSLVSHDGEGVPLAVADPLAVTSVDKGPALPVVVATFINRIALWGVFLEPTGRGKRAGGLAATGLFGFLQKVRRDGPIWCEADEAYRQRMSVAYCSAGETNSSIARSLFKHESFSLTGVNGFGTEEVEAVTGSGAADLALTATPWYADLVKESLTPSSKGRLKWERVVPRVPFPFSSVVADQRDAELGHQEPRRQALEVVLSALRLALTISQRDWARVSQYLSDISIARRYRYYGLPAEAEAMAVVAKTIRGIVNDDCLAESFADPWASWELAVALRRVADPATSRELVHRNGSVLEASEWMEAYRAWTKVTMPIGPPPHPRFGEPGREANDETFLHSTTSLALEKFYTRTER